jgi:acetylornithine/succinyldiaminopimelate/putrescine aminotransferase
VANAAERGEQLIAGLLELAERDERIGDVRGRGLMIGVEFVKDRATREPDGDLAKAVIARCADEGLLVLTCGTAHNVVRWIPPLDVTSDEIGLSGGLPASSRALAARRLGDGWRGVDGRFAQRAHGPPSADKGSRRQHAEHGA